MFKKFSFITIFILLLIPVFLQVKQVNANILPLTSPLTPPLTPPITSPVTPPLSFFNLRGHVVYHQIGWWWTHRFTDAANVVITVDSFFNKTKKHYQATTDGQGNYELNVDPGMYRVSANDDNNTPFVPPFRIVNVKNKSVTNADFQGLVFSKFHF